MTQSEILCCPPTESLRLGHCFGHIHRLGRKCSSLLGCASLDPLQRANGARPAYSWRHGQFGELVLVKVLNFHTALQHAFIFRLLETLSVSVVKHSMPVLLSVSS